MAYGGGTFTVMNKVLPGTYINFDGRGGSLLSTDTEGIVACPMVLNWGKTGEIIEVTRDEVIKKAYSVFGYNFASVAMTEVREIFQNASKLLLYRLNSGGNKAACTYATAKYEGIRGNSIKIVIKANVDDGSKYDVQTWLDKNMMDTQTVASAAGLIDNDFVEFDKEATLQATAGVSLTGGSNGTTTTESHSRFLDLISTYRFNVLVLPSDASEIKVMYAEYTKEMRDNIGVKFQTVLFNYTADYEGVINVKNEVTTVGANGWALVYWVGGLCASRAANESAMNARYTGEYDIDTAFSQSQLIAVRENGEFCLHRVDDEIRVLYDINSLVTTDETKGEVFKDNKTIRVIDYIANAVATIFNTSYIGIVPNDEAGRAALRSDILSVNRSLENIRAIDTFNEETLTVEEGETKRAVIVNEVITLTGTMEQLYMTVMVE